MVDQTVLYSLQNTTIVLKYGRTNVKRLLRFDCSRPLAIAKDSGVMHDEGVNSTINGRENGEIGRMSLLDVAQDADQFRSCSLRCASICR